MDPEILRELGEWAALGFYEGLSLPWPRCYGLGYRRLYENMAITVPAGRLLFPQEPLPSARTRESDGLWWAESLICDFQHNTGLRVNPETAALKKKAFPQHTDFIDALVADLTPRLPVYGGYTHTNPDMRRVLDEGFLAMEEAFRSELQALQQTDADPDPAELNLLLALDDYLAGVRAFHSRTCAALRETAADSDPARHEELLLLADSLEHGFLYPAQTFLEGILAINFVWMLDGCDSIGRFDQLLGPLFEKDIAEGTMTLSFARRILDEVWQNFERFNGWNLQIGGRVSGGGDGTNELTFECLRACERNKMRRPNVAFRITADTPETAVLEALRVLGKGSGRPALYNDDLYIDTLSKMDLGIRPEDVCEIGFGGCTETMIAGCSNVGCIGFGDLNLAKALELSLNDGYDPVLKIHAGPHTGRFESFADFPSFLNAVKRQIQFLTDDFVARLNIEIRKRFTGGDPKLNRTFFTRDCVERHKSFEGGGARYNWEIVSYHGVANLIDSLSAIRHHVFEQKTLSPKQLLDALDRNFEGCEDVRRLLQSAPRFGNDDDRVDDIATEIITYAWEELYAHPMPRGGRYIPSCILFVTYAWFGRMVGATPDGRKAFDVLTDSIGPAQGRDINGPTAMLNSVTKLPLKLAIGTPVLNLRLAKNLFRDEAHLRNIAALLKTYFAKGGLQLQLSVVDGEEMLKAQKEPEKHRDLLVRIGGYSEYFTLLEPALQDSVIARTEHGLN